MRKNKTFSERACKKVLTALACALDAFHSCKKVVLSTLR
jgi:hypothetical protein